MNVHSLNAQQIQEQIRFHEAKIAELRRMIPVEKKEQESDAEKTIPSKYDVSGAPNVQQIQEKIKADYDFKSAPEQHRDLILNLLTEFLLAGGEQPAFVFRADCVTVQREMKEGMRDEITGDKRIVTMGRNFVYRIIHQNSRKRHDRKLDFVHGGNYWTSSMKFLGGKNPEENFSCLKDTLQLLDQHTWMFIHAMENLRS